jgi:hypothetical protein
MIEDGGPRHIKQSAARGVWFALCGRWGIPAFAGTMPLGTYLKHDPGLGELCVACAAKAMIT